MNHFYYQVIELFPTENGDGERVVWQFEDEETAIKVMNIILENDFTYACVKVKKVPVSKWK